MAGNLFSSPLLGAVAISVIMSGVAYGGSCTDKGRKVELMDQSKIKAHTEIKNLSSYAVTVTVLAKNNSGGGGKKIDGISQNLKKGDSMHLETKNREEQYHRVTFSSSKYSADRICAYIVTRYSADITKWERDVFNLNSELCDGKYPVACEKAFNKNDHRWKTTFTILDEPGDGTLITN